MDTVTDCVTVSEGITPLVDFMAAAFDTLDNRFRPGTWSTGTSPVVLFGDQVAAGKVLDTPVRVAPDIIPPEINPAGHFCLGQHPEDTVLVDPVLLDDEISTLGCILHQVDTCMEIPGNIIVGDIKSLVTSTTFSLISIRLLG
jgi:hypothetical protein